MTIAELADVLRSRARSRIAAEISLAWRTAYYQRVKHMPDLSAELAEFYDAAGSREADVDDEGHLTGERADRIWQTLRAGVVAWNAKLSAKGAARP